MKKDNKIVIDDAWYVCVFKEYFNYFMMVSKYGERIDYEDSLEFQEKTVQLLIDVWGEGYYAGYEDIGK